MVVDGSTTSESCSVVSDFATRWTIQSTELSRPEYCSGQPFPSPGGSSQSRHHHKPPIKLKITKSGTIRHHAPPGVMQNIQHHTLMQCIRNMLYVDFHIEIRMTPFSTHTHTHTTASSRECSWKKFSDHNQINFLDLTKHHGNTISQILNEGSSIGYMTQFLPQIKGKRKETKSRVML